LEGLTASGVEEREEKRIWANPNNPKIQVQETKLWHPLFFVGLCGNEGPEFRSISRAEGLGE